MNPPSSPRAFWRRIPAFWLFTITYCLLWSICCTVFQGNYRDDILEQIYVGDQWVISTAKHPFIFSWFLNVIRLILFDAEICPYLASALFTLIILWGIHELARKFFEDETLAFLTVLISASFRYLMVGNLMFNHDLFQALCWVLIVLYFYRALADGRLRDWLSLGLWVGLGLQAKYSILFFLLAIPVFTLCNRQARKSLATKGPYCALAVALLVFLPHFIWLVQNDFITLQYAIHDSPHRLRDWYFEQPIPLFLLLPLVFLGSLLTTLILPLIASAPLAGCVWQWKLRKDSDSEPADRFHVAFLTAMVLLPLAAHLLVAACGRALPTRYTMSLGMFIPFWTLYLLRLRTDRRAIVRTTVLGLILVFGAMIAWSGGLVYDARYGKKPSMTVFPGRKLAEMVERTWTDRFGDVPCPYTTDMYIYTLPVNVYRYGKMKIPINHPNLTLGVTDEEMNRRGGIVLWNMQVQPDMDEKRIRWRFPRAELIEPLEIPYEKPLSERFPPEKIGVAIIPPE